jgi:DNA-binding LacI/PurR family transcriptional regulator
VAELTQRQIAKLARVSQATVSRVLNNDLRVNDEARERVRAVIQTHDYVPNARAQSLRAGQSGALGLVVHRTLDQLTHDPFFSALIISILQVSGRCGFHLCVDTARTLASQRTIHEELLRTGRVDGLILVESQDHDERIERLIERGFPFVLIGRYGNPEAADTPYSVDNDNVAAGKMVAEHLIAAGRRRIAYIGGPAEVNVSIDRLAGYRAALAAHDIPFDAHYCIHGDFTAEGGRRGMARLLRLSPRPDAVIAIDDLTAAGAMRAARDADVAIPAQIAFVGFNDSSICDHLEPPLSSVSIETEALACLATEMLIDLIEGNSVTPRRRIVPCRLIERASTRRR